MLLTPSLPSISACNMPGKIRLFYLIIVLHIISYKIITTVGIYTNFFLLVEAFDTMSEIMFSSDSMSNFFKQL